MVKHRIVPSLFRHLRALEDLILPRECIVCGCTLITTEKHICLHCLADLPLTHFHLRHHNPMADRFNSIIQDERYAFATALFFFNNEAGYRRIPYQIKYEGNIPAGVHFGKMLGRMINEGCCFKDVDAVIPVPLHWRRMWKRGYNQAEIIASGVSDEIKVPLYTDILSRKKNTKTQTQLTSDEKSANVKGAFSANIGRANKVIAENRRHIILIDDVFTSGSTLSACYKALRAVFPPSVRISVASLGFVGG